MKPIHNPRRLAPPGHRERRHMGAMAGFIAVLHLLGWGTLVAIVVPQHLRLGATAFGLGIGATAYVLGLRHAVDADHIAAIDNTTRRLMSRGERPVSVGFWFALGHSTVVFTLALLIGLGARALPSELLNEHSRLHGALVVLGTTASAGFLYVIAMFNITAFAGIWRLFRRMRNADYDELAFHSHLDNRGPISRLAQRVGGPVEKPWHMYLVGILFGLGFDTATEIALLLLAGTGSASGLPWYAVLCLPVLFAAGMSLLDSLDGTVMNFAYGWSLSQPVRKLYYNLTITGLSIAVAITIGTVELIGLLHDKFGLHDGLWGWLSGVNLNTIGFLIVGLFGVTWAVSVLVWKYARIEEKWGRPMTSEPAASET